MEIKCEFCGSLIPDEAEKCPNCGATNVNMQRAAIGVPHTIEELKQWYNEHGLPPYETTRYFIGVDYKRPRVIGIYKDGDKYIVYKNKSDGSRAVRYEGTDEDYAVNEFYLKLKSEILNQKWSAASLSGTNRQDTKLPAEEDRQHSSGSRSDTTEIKRFTSLVATIAIIVFCLIFLMTSNHGCSQSGSNSSNTITPILYDDGETWYNGTPGYSSGNSYSNSYSNNNSSYFDTWDDDWDNDFSWDSNDSWDSDYSDWDSDW